MYAEESDAASLVGARDCDGTEGRMVRGELHVNTGETRFLSSEREAPRFLLLMTKTQTLRLR